MDTGGVGGEEEYGGIRDTKRPGGALSQHIFNYPG